jgi:outer membrane protein assembly factor BamB
MIMRENNAMPVLFLRKLALIIPLVLVLQGCETWNKIFTDEETRLPGKRFSVLLHQKNLLPDPELEGREILLPAPSINADWPQAGGYANHAMHHILVNDTLKEAWDIDIGSGREDEIYLVASPVVAKGRIFVMDSETNVSAYDTKTGDMVWEAELTPEDEDDGHIGGGVAYDQGRIFAATGFAEIVALDAESGKILWRRSLGGPMRTTPTVRGGRVFAVTLDNKLHALNAVTGASLWAHSGITESASMLGGGSPAVDSGVVVVPYSSGELVALKVENGRLLWSDSLAFTRRTDAVSSISHIRGRPVIDRGMVFAVSYAGLMVAIDLPSGRRVWDKEIGSLESLWVAGNYIYILTSDLELICLARENGSVYWVQSLPHYEDEEDKEGPIVWTGPILASDRLIIAGSDGEALAVSPYTGRILGAQEMPDSVSVPPIAANGSVYFLTDDADLVAYR